MKQIVFLYFVFFISLTATSQNLQSEIEVLFSTWKKPNNPGGNVLISHKNKIIFSETYGLANIPYRIPMEKETIFNIGSVSKQFTAMGIIVLQLEGKLSIDDKIHKYLPELNHFEKPITIRHLLHHTSGIRSSPEMFGLAGWRDGDAISNEDAYRYLAKQTDLNFATGTEYMYSNSGYILLAKIIENITKQNFKTWMKEKIFQPLQLNATFIEEDFSKITTQTATSYTETEPSIYTTIENNDLTYGASNVYSTIEDILKWSKYYLNAPNEWKKAFAMLQTLDVLPSGSTNNYAFGVFVDDFYGNSRIQHSGAIAGFQSIVYSYPDEDLQIVILSNFTSNQLSKIADQISQLFLQNKSKSSKNEETIHHIHVDSEILKKYEGMYWNDKNNYSRKIYLENETLWYLRSNGKKSPLIPIAETQFQIGGINEKLLLKFEVSLNKMTLFSPNNVIDTFDRYEDKALTTEELKKYTGTFYSPELETSYQIIFKNDKLYGYHSRFGEFEIQILKKDILSWSGMAISKYKMDKSGNIVGLYISMNRIRNLWFEKKQTI